MICISSLDLTEGTQDWQRYFNEIIQESRGKYLQTEGLLRLEASCNMRIGSLYRGRDEMTRDTVLLNS